MLNGTFSVLGAVSAAHAAQDLAHVHIVANASTTTRTSIQHTTATRA
jgi:hypothetical protein